MFDEFYGFKQTPFVRNIPYNKLYRENDTNEIIGRLKYTADKQLFAVISGESGTGKTTLLRLLEAELRLRSKGSEYKTLYISDAYLTPRIFYRIALEQLGFEAKFYRGDARRQLNKEIETLKTIHGITPVAIVDEAHLLDREMLEEIRFLLNNKMDSESPVALILCGQSELWDKLKLNSRTAIRQRIDIVCHVNPLDKSQTISYIKSNLRYAESATEIFSESAYDAIFNYTAGVMRVINKVCTASLSFAAQNRKTIIDERMIKRIIEDEIA